MHFSSTFIQLYYTMILYHNRNNQGPYDQGRSWIRGPSPATPHLNQRSKFKKQSWHVQHPRVVTDVTSRSLIQRIVTHPPALAPSQGSNGRRASTRLPVEGRERKRVPCALISSRPTAGLRIAQSAGALVFTRRFRSRIR